MPQQPDWLLPDDDAPADADAPRIITHSQPADLTPPPVTQPAAPTDEFAAQLMAQLRALG